MTWTDVEDLVYEFQALEAQNRINARGGIRPDYLVEAERYARYADLIENLVAEDTRKVLAFDRACEAARSRQVGATYQAIRDYVDEVDNP